MYFRLSQKPYILVVISNVEYIAKKSVYGQCIRKQQHFKKKYRRRKAILDHKVEQFRRSNIMDFTEETKLPSIKKQYFPLHKEKYIDPTIFLPDYSILADKNFKRTFLLAAIGSTTISQSGAKKIKKLLRVEDNLSFIRQLTQLINTRHYLQLQNEQCNHYYQLGMTEGIWTGRVSKNMAALNSLPRTYSRSKLSIQQRQKKYQTDLFKIDNEINMCIAQIPRTLNQFLDQTMVIIRHLIYQDQSQLRMELEGSRTLLKSDAHDHQLFQAFYNLKPRKTEIHSTNLIWKATYDEYQLRYEPELFKHWQSSSQSSSFTMYTIKDLQLPKINEIFTNVILNERIFSFSSGCHSTLPRKQNEATITAIELGIAKYADKVRDQKEKLLNNQDKFTKPPSVTLVFDAIKHREMNMAQRAQFKIEHTIRILLARIYKDFTNPSARLSD
ncbi:unnamed protein product [Adineta ricciae]|uniref:Uncharacterized protein n=1 Tax=Adineta ricciae TaxID=249248 RepID=A0A815UDA0_ADIRI|nr:unnamed protein product [Adineta ricciae]